MDEHRNMWSMIERVWMEGDERPYADIKKAIEELVSATASKSEKDGWNKAINEAAHYACDAVHHVSCKPLSMEKKGHYIAKHIRRLIREEK
jgi:hypothetical protein